MHMKNMVLRIVLGLVLASIGQPGWAQAPARAPSAKPGRVPLMIAEWTRAKDWTAKYIKAMPEENFKFKPVPEVRSFAEQMLHLAYWNFGFTAKAFGKALPYSEEQLMTGDFQTKAALTKIVADSYDFVIKGL